MFTGITEEIGTVKSVRQSWLAISAERVTPELMLGDSIAVNGVCLTVISIEDNSFSAEVMPETLRRTNLGELRRGDKVNLERPLPIGGRLGGHLVQGHVDAVGRIVSLTPQGEAILVKFAAPPEVMCYVVERGFIAVDGVSLTVAYRTDVNFTVSLVTYTQRHTALGSKKPGAIVNLEVDIIAKYVQQLARKEESGISLDFLAKHGLLTTS